MIGAVNLRTGDKFFHSRLTMKTTRVSLSRSRFAAFKTTTIALQKDPHIPQLFVAKSAQFRCGVY